jgi:hypothetical protein
MVAMVATVVNAAVVINVNVAVAANAAMVVIVAAVVNAAVVNSQLAVLQLHRAVALQLLAQLAQQLQPPAHQLQLLLLVTFHRHQPLLLQRLASIA